MSLSARKFIAVLLAIWLPLFSGNALAAGVSMQMPHGTCHEMDLAAMQDMGDQHNDQTPSHDPSSCNALCHLACGGYMGVQEIKALTVPQTEGSATPYQFSFHSISTLPLLPPPLTRA